MATGPKPALWIVAGCLFEVSLPAGEMGPWRWANSRPEVTLLSDETRQGAHCFRFRAEALGAEAGMVELRFRSADPGEGESCVAVLIAPEMFGS